MRCSTLLLITLTLLSLTCITAQRICIQGGPVPAECPDNYKWNGEICRWECITDVPAGQDVPTQPTAPTPEVTSNGTVGTVCSINPCDDPENAKLCPHGCIPDFSERCDFFCEQPPPRLGETIRTIQFVVGYTNKRSTKDTATVLKIHDGLVYVADRARIGRSDYIINNAEIVRVSGQKDSLRGNWQVKIGFRAYPGGDGRSIYIKQLYRMKLIRNPDEVELLALTPLDGFDVDETQAVVMAREVATVQSCADGRMISALEMCEAVAAPASSSSTTPIVAIVIPIIVGVILLAVIATVMIVRRRRHAFTIKTMTTMQTTTVEQQV